MKSPARFWDTPHSKSGRIGPREAAAMAWDVSAGRGRLRDMQARTAAVLLLRPLPHPPKQSVQSPPTTWFSGLPIDGDIDDQATETWWSDAMPRGELNTAPAPRPARSGPSMGNARQFVPHLLTAVASSSACSWNLICEVTKASCPGKTELNGGLRAGVGDQAW